MELTQLTYFLCVAEQLHVTRAAGLLCITQPALTRSIRRLEEELGVRLLTAKGRNIALTPCGQALYERIRGPLAQLNALPQELRRLQQGGSRTIRLNVLAASATVTAAMIDYRRTEPDVIFNVVQNESDDDCDIAVRTQAAAPEDAGPFLSEEILLAVPADSPLAAAGSCPLSALKKEGFICLAGSRQFRQICDRLCHRVGFSPRVVFESDNPATVCNLIEMGGGVGFWPAVSWGNPENGVRLLHLTDPDCRRVLVIEKSPRCQPQDAADRFYRFLTDWMGRKLAQGQTGGALPPLR